MKMGKYDEGRFLRAQDLEESTNYTLFISSVTEETVKDRNGADKTFPVLWFRDKKKGFGLSAKINRNMCVHNFGSDETDDFIGRKIVLYRTVTEFQGQVRPCVRIRSKEELGDVFTETPTSPNPDTANTDAGAAPAVDEFGDDEIPF